MQLDDLTKFVPQHELVKQSTTELLTKIFENISERSREEIYQGLGPAKNEDLVGMIINHAKISFVIVDTLGTPQAVFALFRLKPSVLETCMVTTTDWGMSKTHRKTRLITTRILRQFLVDVANARIIRRVEMRVLSPTKEIDQWYQCLGATKEGELCSFGIDETTFWLYAWTYKHLEKMPKIHLKSTDEGND